MDYTKLTDEELCERFLSNDTQAFEELHKRYQLLIKSLARQKSYFSLNLDNDDLVIEGFMGLYKASLSYDKNSNVKFKTYAITCIKNQIANAIKKTSIKKHEILNTAEDLGNYQESMTVTPEEDFIFEEEIKEYIDKIKGLLSPLENKIFDLFIRGYEYTVIAQELNLTSKTVDNGIQRIKNKVSKLQKTNK